MFTGIVEEIGRIRRWRQDSSVCQIGIACERIRTDLGIGDSIAVNGVCLTAARLEPDGFTADVMVESLRKTALDQLEVGSPVNLERALAVGDRLGGHWVSGHIDGTGIIRQIRRERNSIWYVIGMPEDVLAWLVPQGSVALDGTSLTVAALDDQTCSVSLIPHTAAATVLGQRTVGERVNVEADMLGKYVRRYLEHMSKTGSKLTWDFLERTGFRS